MTNWKQLLVKLKNNNNLSSADFDSLSIEERILIDDLLENNKLEESIALLEASNIDVEWNELSTKIQFTENKVKISPYRLFGKSLIKYAAILALPLLFASILYIQRSPYFSVALTEYNFPTKNHNQAVLVLDDGSKVQLDESHNLKGLSSFALVDDKTVDYSQTIASNDPQYHTLIVPIGSDYSLVLSDGSKIHVNAGSEIKFPIQFKDQSTREVFLVKGEAFFDIVSNPDQPFIVNTQGLEISVLGTSFNVNTYAEAIYTTLVEGKVKIKNKTRSIVLHPNQQVIAVKGDDQFLLKDVEVDSYLGWHHNLWVFDSTSLEEIMSSLSDWYGYEVIFEDEGIKNLQYAAKLHKYSKIQEVLALLEKTEKIIFTVKNNKIFVHKASAKRTAQ